ncbi:hypothetical protein TNCV_1349721 [Trichonephila clavipes]|nr:hypothetical protein TNCV_1349721 [Trichonephila clavipes]
MPLCNKRENSQTFRLTQRGTSLSSSFKETKCPSIRQNYQNNSNRSDLHARSLGLVSCDKAPKELLPDAKRQGKRHTVSSNQEPSNDLLSCKRRHAWGVENHGTFNCFQLSLS